VVQMSGRESDRIRGTTREVDVAARAMRQEPTPAEAALWDRLRSRRLDGAKFRAQHPVGRFIFDFYCAQARLVVEVDGGVHDARRERDAERDLVLRSAGYLVLRLTNKEVLGDIERVLAEIRRHVAMRATR
jgi:very-short-patch-repair endonuclease